MVARTLSTHGRSKHNVDVVSARSVFGFLGLDLGLGLRGAIGCVFCVLTHTILPTGFYNHTYHGILFVCCSLVSVGLVVGLADDIIPLSFFSIGLIELNYISTLFIQTGSFLY